MSEPRSVPSNEQGEPQMPAEPLSVTSAWSGYYYRLAKYRHGEIERLRAALQWLAESADPNKLTGLFVVAHARRALSGDSSAPETSPEREPFDVVANVIAAYQGDDDELARRIIDSLTAESLLIQPGICPQCQQTGGLHLAVCDKFDPSPVETERNDAGVPQKLLESVLGTLGDARASGVVEGRTNNPDVAGSSPASSSSQKASGEFTKVNAAEQIKEIAAQMSERDDYR